MRNIFLLCCSLLGLPATLLAQEIAPAPFARWYGSVQYGRQTYQLFNPPKLEPWLTNARRTQLSTGYQLNPSWAFQVGWGYSGNKFITDNFGTNTSGQPVTEQGWTKDRSHAFSAVARYTFLRFPLQKFQLEWIAGPVLLRRRNWGEFTRTENGVVTEKRLNDNRATDWYVVAGPGLSYALGRHFQATSELLFNRNLRTTKYEIKTFRSLGIGLRYRFGYK
ncbi:outer membrane beta-barrel protein [Hymenobacter rubripertinctus]|uniref:Outer membrane protein beta-barrel domain-containing protein n=1 Tax=Hymenobacter rubripertinctus TaxID=2029981 RepID=A0A418QLY5_9BACT|nr:outer membrane beta-barrel protein [Hymenobacter rubripertinctus]RIY06236.1 hypothetical protein D0T11_19090 [Hymenobacter rubripertinctus]